MKAPDLLRRFTPTPLGIGLCLLGRAIRLETNSAGVLEHTRRAFAGYGRPPAGGMDFLWKFVSEDSDQSRAVPSGATVIRDENLLFVNLGRHGFIAVDGKEHEAVGFVEDGWEGAFLPALLWVVTASALGLTMVSAACLAHGMQAVLILGPREATASFLDQVVGHLRLRIHARRTVFVEAGRSGLQVWGEFWAQGSDFEQPVLANPCDGLPHVACRAANLVGCIWIDRQSPAGHSGPLVEPSALYSAAASSAFQKGPVRPRLDQLPGYHLDSGDDPIHAFRFVENVLGRGSAWEAV